MCFPSGTLRLHLCLMYEIVCSVQECVSERSKCVTELQLKRKAALLFKVWLHFV